MKLRCGLIGGRLVHSYSPQIHAELGDYDYKLFELKEDEVGPFLKRGEFDGLNVTIPYKKTVLPYIDELSDKFDMPVTAMKLCFKNVFGLPVFTYARRERMKIAAKELRESDRGILEIAGEVGYNNGSKFAHAFQDVMGMTPKEYRKKYRLTNVA